MLGDCHASDCPKDEVEQVLATLSDVFNKAGHHGAFKLAFTLPEAKARMALALATAKLTPKSDQDIDS